VVRRVYGITETLLTRDEATQVTVEVNSDFSVASVEDGMR
jgi:hypothetical protein